MNGEAPQHLIRWSWADWMTSRVRTRSFVTGDRDLRLVYLELLNLLYSRGGEVEGSSALLSDLLGIPMEVIDQEMPILLELDAIQMDDKTRIISNRRVTAELDRCRSLSEKRRRAGRAAHEQTLANAEQVSANADMTSAKGNGNGMGNGKGNGIEDVFNYWKKLTKHPKAVLNDSRIATLKRRLSEDPDGVAGLKRAVDGAMADPFYRGDNDRGKTYLGFDNIFRNRDRIEKLQDSAKRYVPKRLHHADLGLVKLPPQDKKAVALFEKVRDKIDLAQHSKRTWLLPCEGWAFENEGTVLVVTCPSKQHKAWLTGYLKAPLRKACQAVRPGLLVRLVVREVTP